MKALFERSGASCGARTRWRIPAARDRDLHRWCYTGRKITSHGGIAPTTLFLPAAQSCSLLHKLDCSFFAYGGVMLDFEVLRRLASVAAISEQETDKARAARDYPEAQTGQFEGRAATAPTHTVPKLDDDQVRALLSEEARVKVIEFEVTSENVYRRKYERAEAPGGKSGITIGIGYDLGYNTAEDVRRDLEGLISADDIETLVGACGLKGNAARSRLSEFRDVRVPWEAAAELYRRVTVPKFGRKVLNTFPFAAELNGHCFGALFSLVYNRGESLDGDRRREMLKIRDLMAARDYPSVPQQFIAMNRLWEGDPELAGVVKRRKAEAALFQRGLELIQQPIVVASSATGGNFESMSATRDADLAAMEGDGYGYKELDDSAGVLEATEPPGWAKVAWPPDDRAPDYSHIPDRSLAGTTFEFGPRELELLIEANAFQPHREDGRIVFALRGAQLAQSLQQPTPMDRQENRDALTLKEGKPDHNSLRCVIGVYDMERNKMYGFSASTVPNPKAIDSYVSGGTPSNMMLTGCYQFTVGWHQESKDDKKIPGTLVEHGRFKAVLRTKNDHTFDITDMVYNAMPGDNVHPGKSEGKFPFSSWGCLVLKGSVTPVRDGDRANVTHTGEWAQFRKALGLPDRGTGKHGQRVDVILLTGLDAAIAANFAKATPAVREQTLLQQLTRLRQGSQGPRVALLRRALHLDGAGSNVFDSTVATKLADIQRAKTGGGDGLYAPAMDAVLGMQIFAPIGPVASLESNMQSPTQDRDGLAFELGSQFEAARAGRGGHGEGQLEGLGSTIVEMGTHMLVETGDKLLRQAETSLRSYICEQNGIGQRLDRDDIRSRVDNAARVSTVMLKQVLVVILRQATFQFASYATMERVVTFVLDQILPPKDSAGDQVLQRIDGGVEWLCGKWSDRITTVYGDAGRNAPAAPAPRDASLLPPQQLSASKTAIPIIAPSSVMTPPAPANNNIAVKPSDAAKEAGRLLVLLGKAADGATPDTQAVRNYIHRLRNHLRDNKIALSPDENQRFLDILCDSRFMAQISGAAGHDPYKLIEDIEIKLRGGPQDRAAVTRLLRDFSDVLSDARVPIQPDAVSRLLDKLRGEKLFDELAMMADRFLTRDPKLLGLVSNWYAQGLIDSGKLVAAIQVLHAADEIGERTKAEVDDAEGLRGRAHKQIYVNFVRSPSDAAALGATLADQLIRSAKSYGGPYDPTRALETAYHGVNYLAVLKRAERDRIKIDGAPNADDVAHTLIAQLEPAAPGAKDPYLLASLGEAYLGLGNLDKAAEYLGLYASHPDVDAFKLNGTVRQLEQVWQLSASAAGAGAILTGLKAALSAKENGFVSFSQTERRQLAHAQSVQFQQFFETKVEGGRFQKLYDLQRIVQRGAAVAAIQQMMGNTAQTVGTGFLLNGADLGAGLSPDKSYVLTNAHVIWDPTKGAGAENQALRPEQAQVIFEGLMYDSVEIPFKCSRVVWQSPSSLHDATLIELDRVVAGVKPLELAARDMRLDVADEGKTGTRLAVVGHPEGGSLSVSVLGSLDKAEATLVDRGPQGNASDPEFLHYRTPTEPGNSGSPVFEVETWKVVALHHAGYDQNRGRPKLGGKAGTNFANEGIWIGSIRDAVKGTTEPKPPKKRSWFS